MIRKFVRPTSRYIYNRSATSRGLRDIVRNIGVAKEAERVMDEIIWNWSTDAYREIRKANSCRYMLDRSYGTFFGPEEFSYDDDY